MHDALLTVVVPAFNEESRLELSLQTIHDYLLRQERSFEIIVVDDGSTDRTARIAARFAQRPEQRESVRVLLNGQNRGKGYSVRRGMLESKGELGLMTDADLSTPIEELSTLEERLDAEELDVAFGSRDLAESDLRVRQPWYRENLGKAFNRLVRLWTGLPYSDTQCGFKLFRMSSCRTLFQLQRIERFVFDVELLFIARKQSLRVAEIPVTWSHASGSKVSVLGTAPSTVIDLIRIRLNNAKGRYTPNTTE